MRLLGLLFTAGIIALLVAYYIEYGGFTLDRQVVQYKKVNQQVEKVQEDIDKYNGILNTYENKLEMETDPAQ